MTDKEAREMLEEALREARDLVKLIVRTDAGDAALKIICDALAVSDETEWDRCTNMNHTRYAMHDCLECAARNRRTK